MADTVEKMPYIVCLANRNHKQIVESKSEELGIDMTISLPLFKAGVYSMLTKSGLIPAE